LIADAQSVRDKPWQAQDEPGMNQVPPGGRSRRESGAGRGFISFRR
jgi:hypothetical protein